MSEPDARFFQKMISDELDRRGGGGYDGGMDDVLRRIGSLEGEMKEMKADVKGLSRDVSEIKGKLSNMPTTFQMMTWFVGVSVTLIGLTFTIAKIVAH